MTMRTIPYRTDADKNFIIREFDLKEGAYKIVKAYPSGFALQFEEK